MAGKVGRPLVVGNWKMNGLASSVKELRGVVAWLQGPGKDCRCELMICPPATLLVGFADRAKKSALLLGGQDCHVMGVGAHTGDISARMLKDAGAGAVIVGHSERRIDHGEDNALVRAKAAGAHKAGLVSIICIGESLAEHKAGRTLRVVSAQLKASLPARSNARNTVIAYEPVWAIGSGLTPTLAQVAGVHGHIRMRLRALLGEGAGALVRILYGGSVNPKNAAGLMAVVDVNGALVGGSSLKARDFTKIAGVYCS